jgi:hypothetical protein
MADAMLRKQRRELLVSDHESFLLIADGKPEQTDPFVRLGWIYEKGRKDSRELRVRAEPTKRTESRDPTKRLEMSYANGERLKSPHRRPGNGSLTGIG